MRTHLIIICGVLMLWTSIVKGSERLGETVEQCEARYGKPVFTQTTNTNIETTRNYQVGVYSLYVGFFGGEALRIMYSRTDKGLLTDEEIQYLLKINSQSTPWKEKTLNGAPMPGSLDRQWTRDDGTMAFLQGGKTQFVVVSPKVTEIYKAVQAEAETKKLQETRESLNKL